MLDILTLILAGIMDRIRGGFPKGRPGWMGHVARMAAYAMMVSLVTHNVWLVLAGFAFGDPAWRQDNGWRGHWLRNDQGKRWWQPLRWAAIWCAPLLLIAWWEPKLLLLFPCVTAGAYLGIWLPIQFQNEYFYTPWSEWFFECSTAWGWSELLELPIAGALVLWCLSLF